MAACLVIGGVGYIGSMWINYVLENRLFSTVYVADVKPWLGSVNDNIIHTIADVRKPISTGFIKHPIDWIFNFAAIHREPGHAAHEYFETNLKGAENVCILAEKIGCKNIFFTSSISVYGPTLTPTDEYALPMPNTPYGISKLMAEYIHKNWCAQDKSHRLIIVRPGVIYGPHDPGNILRMIKAVKKGYFFLPTSPAIKKSYGYIYGLMESMAFAMQLPDKTFCYNYVEHPTESLGKLIALINQTLAVKGKIIRLPMGILVIAAKVIHRLFPNINGIHPERVKKVARPTHIVPKKLMEKGFDFRYDFKSSLLHWKNQSNDF